MGRRGPPKKPSVLKLHSGSRQMPRGEVQPVAPKGLPSPPEWLSDAAVIEWNRIGPEMVRLGLLTNIDLIEFAAYCQAAADIVECRAIIATQGRTVTTDKGNEVQHPVVGQYHRAMELMHRFAGSFGLSPASRASLDVKPQEATPVATRKRS